MDYALKTRHLSGRGPNDPTPDNPLAGLPSSDLRKLLKWIRSRGLIRINELPAHHIASIRETGIDQYLSDIHELERIRQLFKPETRPRRPVRRL